MVPLMVKVVPTLPVKEEDDTTWNSSRLITGVLEANGMEYEVSFNA